MKKPAIQFCRMSLKAKPSATEPMPRLVKISTGRIDGSRMVITTRKPKKYRRPEREAREHVGEIVTAGAIDHVAQERRNPRRVR